MPEINFIFIVAVMSVLGCFLAAVHSFLVYRSSRLSKSWLAVTYGLVFLSFDRLVVFSREFGFLDWLFPEELKTWSGFFTVIATAFLIWGFVGLRKSFESFDIIEKKSKEKAKQFEGKN